MYEYVENILEKINSEKILVINRKSGKKYYINKDRFDYRIHAIPPVVKKKKKEEPKKKDKPKKNSSKSSSKSSDKSSKKDDKKESEPIEKDTSDEIKTDEPNLKLKEKLGSSVFFNKFQQANVFKFGKNIRADIKKKVLETDLTFYLKKYDDFISFFKNGIDVDAEAIKNSIMDLGKKVQKIALFKLGILSSIENDPDVNTSTLEYKKKFNDVNEYLRSGKYVFSYDEISAIKDKLKIDPDSVKTVNISEHDMKILEMIHDMDKHFNSDGSISNADIIVYRAVSRDVLDEFLKAGAWKDKSYVSTTLNPFLFKNFSSNIFDKNTTTEQPIIFRIIVPNNFNILFLSCDEDENCIESEIILPRNCDYFIHNKDIKRNVYTVSVRRG